MSENLDEPATICTEHSRSYPMDNLRLQARRVLEGLRVLRVPQGLITGGLGRALHDTVDQGPQPGERGTGYGSCATSKDGREAFAHHGDMDRMYVSGIEKSFISRPIGAVPMSGYKRLQLPLKPLVERFSGTPAVSRERARSALTWRRVLPHLRGVRRRLQA